MVNRRRSRLWCGLALVLAGLVAFVIAITAVSKNQLALGVMLQFAAVFGGRARMRILLESSTESEWVATGLEELGHEVIVADPNFAAMYGSRTRRIKTDRRDVAALAKANRTGVYRAAHRVSPASPAIRQRLLVRDQLVRMRTQLINLVRSQVRATRPAAADGRRRDVQPAIRRA
jgi:transposase